MAVCGGACAATRLVFGGSPAVAGLYAIEEAAGRSCESDEEGSLTGICGADQFTFGDGFGVRS